MRDFIITTDTTCDLPKDYLEEHQIDVVPLYYNFDGQVYGGDKDLTPEEFYAKMRGGLMPTTMAANPETVRELFEKKLAEGRDILHIGFSSGLSSSYNAAAVVGRELGEDHPDAKIIVIDSLCASLGEGLLVHKAVMMKKAGKTIEEVSQWLDENKLHLCHQFTVDDLFHLHRGGRVSKATAIVGTIINVKPVLHVDDEGHLIPLSNVRGRKKALTKLVDNMEKTMGRFKDQNDIFFISHGDCIDDAQFVAQLVKDRFGIKDCLINMVSPTIGAHSGPGTVALFYLGESR